MALNVSVHLMMTVFLCDTHYYDSSFSKKKLRHREVTELAKDHKATDWYTRLQTQSLFFQLVCNTNIQQCKIYFAVFWLSEMDVYFIWLSRFIIYNVKTIETLDFSLSALVALSFEYYNLPWCPSFAVRNLGYVKFID